MKPRKKPRLVAKQSFEEAVSARGMLRWVMYESIGDEFPRVFRREPPGFTLLFALFWSLIVSIACVIVGVGAFRQWQCAYWPRADGIVTVSERRGKRGNSWNLEYTN